MPEALHVAQVEAGAILVKLRELKEQAFLTDDASGIPRFLGKPEVRALLERPGDAEWKMLEPKKGPAKSARVEDLRYALRALRWKDIAEPGGKEPAKYGLDTPAFEVSLYRADGTEIATVQTGKREAERQYVRTKAAPAIYAIDPKQFGELPKVPGDLQG